MLLLHFVFALRCWRPGADLQQIAFTWWLVAKRLDTIAFSLYNRRKQHIRKNHHFRTGAGRRLIKKTLARLLKIDYDRGQPLGHTFLGNMRK